MARLTLPRGGLEVVEKELMAGLREKMIKRWWGSDGEERELKIKVEVYLEKICIGSRPKHTIGIVPYRKPFISSTKKVLMEVLKCTNHLQFFQLELICFDS